MLRAPKEAGVLAKFWKSRLFHWLPRLYLVFWGGGCTGSSWSSL